MKTTKKILLVIITIIYCWSFTDKDAEITEANAAQGDKQVQQQGELKDSTLASVQSVGDVSFVVPGGWFWSPPRPGGDYANVTLQEDRKWCDLTLYSSLSLSGQTVNFGQIWNQFVVPATRAPDWGTDNHTSASGYSGKYGNSIGPDGVFMGLYVLEAENKAIPIQIAASDERVYMRCRDVIRKFVDRVRVAPAKAQPPKISLTIADLVGEWTSDVVGTHTQKNTATGRITDNNTVRDTKFLPTVVIPSDPLAQ